MHASHTTKPHGDRVTLQSLIAAPSNPLQGKIQKTYVKQQYVNKPWSNQQFDINGSLITKIVSEYDQEIPQSQTADNPTAPQGRAAQPSRDTRKTN